MFDQLALNMKAVVRDRFGSPDVLETCEIDLPSVSEKGVLARVHASSVNPADGYAMAGKSYVARMEMGLREPMWRTTPPEAGSMTSLKPSGKCPSRTPTRIARKFCPNSLIERSPKISFEEAMAQLKGD